MKIDYNYNFFQSILEYGFPTILALGLGRDRRLPSSQVWARPLVRYRWSGDNELDVHTRRTRNAQSFGSGTPRLTIWGAIWTVNIDEHPVRQAILQGCLPVGIGSVLFRPWPLGASRPPVPARCASLP